MHGQRTVAFFGERAKQLNQILSMPNIAVSVRTLTLHCYHETLKNPINSALTSTILRRLPHTRNFALKGVWHFSSILEDCASAIQAFCKSPNLTTLCLDSVHYFPFTAITCPNLRLYNSRLDLRNVDSMKEISSPQLSYPDSLEINPGCMYSFRSSPFSKDMPNAIFFSRLTKLQIRDLPYTTRSGWEFMSLLSQTLTTLQLLMCDAHEPQTRMLDEVSFYLGRFPALRYFKIQLQSWYDNNSAYLRFLTRLLSISPSASSSGIEVLEIELTWHGVRHGDRMIILLSDVEWSALDQLLTSYVYGSLSKVVLHLCVAIKDWTWESNSDRERISEFERDFNLPYVNDLFPKFRASTNTRRTLEIHFQVTS
jgi:hypothetical protein